MDFDYAHYMLTEGAKGKENPVVCSPSREAYRKLLAESLNMNRTRILAFKNKPPTPVDLIPHEMTSSTHQQDRTAKPRRIIPQVHYINLIDIPHILSLLVSYSFWFFDYMNVLQSDLKICSN
jgi:cell division cycle protein 20 (cofactor of APC complex)